MTADARSSRFALAGLLALAFALRLIYGLAQDPAAPFGRGGDSWWYLANGAALVTGAGPADVPVDLARLPTPPGYLVLVGLAQAAAPGQAAIAVIIFAQAALAVLMIWACARIAWRLTGRRGAVLLTAALLAVSPALIVETAQVASETLYMALVALGLLLYIEACERRQPGPALAWLGLSGAALGLAALTRAPILLFPLGLALHLLIFFGWRRGGRAALALLAAFVFTVGTWTAYNLARWNRFIIAGEGFAAFLYVGATGWESPQAVDARIGSAEGGADSQTFIAAAGGAIAADPAGYAARRLAELAGAVLQPHGTAYFPGPSLRDLAVGWWGTDRTLAGLAALAQADAFWPKLLIYVFQFGGAAAAVFGLWRARRRPRPLLVLLGFIAYTLLIHVALLALPRYIFPSVIALAPLASAAVFAPSAPLPRVQDRS